MTHLKVTRRNIGFAQNLAPNRDCWADSRCCAACQFKQIFRKQGSNR